MTGGSEARRRGLARLNLHALLARHGALPVVRLSLAALVASLATVLVLALVNSAAQEVAESGIDRVDWPKAVFFAGLLVVYAIAEFYLMARIVVEVENAIAAVHRRIFRLVRGVDLETLERFGQAPLFESITQSTRTISQNSRYIAIVFRSLILVVALFLYILYISRTAFALVVVAVLLAGAIYHRKGKALVASHAGAMDRDNQVFAEVADQLDGWKEVRMKRARRDAIGRAFAAVSEAATRKRVEMQGNAADQYIFGQMAFFFLLGVVVFVVPAYSDVFADDLVRIATAVLFLVAPIGMVIQSVTILSAAETAAGRILAVDARLAAASDSPERAAEPEPGDAAFGSAEMTPDDMRAPGPPPDAETPSTDFSEIRLEEVTYSYEAEGDEHPFRLGPVDFTVRRGEIVFISGGNGSGKSTLVRLLTGLYRLQEGRLTVDGQPVEREALPDHRARIAAVLSDFHLFAKLHGLTHVDPEEVRRRLRQFELADIVGFDGVRFSTTDLSTGQRKRLALVVALLEKRPLLVLDEWAADQDPQFRRHFYRELLPALRAEGLTIVAVTHDDHYYDAADRRVHLREGRFVEPAAAADPVQGG